VDIGVGLPNAVPWATGPDLIEWARRAEAKGFSSVATLGRVAYPNHEDLTVLAAVAAATERIALMTDVLLAPTHNPVLLAKQAASIDAISGGRLRLGIAVGRREDDYEVAGQSYNDRGRRLDDALETMTALWSGQPAPNADRAILPLDGPPRTAPDLVFGGTSEKTIERVVRYGSGWTAGGGMPDRVQPFAQRVGEAWSDAGRGDLPRVYALRYVALGTAADEGRQYLLDYYASLGPAAAGIAESMLTSQGAIAEALRDYEAAGVDEMILFGTVPDPGQVDMLAQATSTLPNR
jgi:alkanesulfonate monooxygenase SsuD/methylene tetrahydromethanopterin reductase-like flavin-dependent oxidoreductase (luciferase family)